MTTRAIEDADDSQVEIDNNQFEQLTRGDINYFENKKITVNVIEKTIVFGEDDDISNLEKILTLRNLNADCELKTFQLAISNKLSGVFFNLLKKHKSKINANTACAYALYKLALEANDSASIKFLRTELLRSDEVDQGGRGRRERPITLSPDTELGEKKNDTGKRKTEKEDYDLCGHMREKLDEFHVRSHPRYLFTNDADPVNAAINLSNKLVECKKKYHENKDEIEILLSRCKKFMVTLVNLCESDDEIRCLFHDKSGNNRDNNFEKINKQSRFWKALDGELTECITHPNVQNWLYKQWLGSLPFDWINKTWYQKALSVTGQILLFPLYSLCYAVAPEKYIVPMNCFLHSIASYIYFLSMLLYTVFDKKSNDSKQSDYISNVQYTVIMWLVAYFFMVVSDFVAITYPSYRHSWWTIYQFVMLCMFWSSGACFLMIEFNIATQLDEYFSIISDGCYSIAITMAFMKILQWFHLSSTLGPVIISFSKMMTVICQMLIIFAVVLFAFSFGVHNLYRNVQFPAQNNDDKIDDDKTFFNNYVNTLKMLFWALFGYGRASAAVVPDTEDADNNALDRTHVISQIGYYMWAFFHVTFVVVLLNMLIAIMTTSYENIQESCDVKWKRARTKIWLHYMARHNAIAPPFNILRYVRISIVALFEMCKSDNQKHDDENPPNPSKTSIRRRKSDDPLGSDFSKDYKTFIRKLADRYKTKNWIDNPPRFTEPKSNVNFRKSRYLNSV